MIFSSFQQKINIKIFMICYLGILFLYSSYFYPLAVLEKGLLIIFLYAGFDLLFTYWRDKVWSRCKIGIPSHTSGYFPLSSVISGLILAIAAIPNPSFILTITLPFLAVFSKQLLHFGKTRHIFNPASFGLAVASLAIPTVAWRGLVSDNPVFLFFIISAGIVILWRQKRWHTALSFFISYGFFLALLAMAQNIQNFYFLLKLQMLNGVTIFFASVMLIEPITSSFGNKRNEIIYGAIVGGTVTLMIYLTQRFHFPNQDPLIYGLLIGNLIASFLFLPKNNKS